MAYGRYGWPTGLLLCCIGLVLQESYIVMHQCQVLHPDYRWIGRSAYFCLIPLTTCMTLEAWAKVGKDFTGLAFSSNQRVPPLCSCCGQWECTLPSFLVGSSFCWYILCFTWIWCSHYFAAPICAGVGVNLNFFGVWFSRYLKRGIVVNEDEEEEQDNGDDEEMATDNCKAKEEEAEEARPEAHPTRISPRPSYDPEDNVLTNLVSRKPPAAWKPITTTNTTKPLPTTTQQQVIDQESTYIYNNKSAPPVMQTTTTTTSPHDLRVHHNMMMVKGKSLGAFDCPKPIP